MGVLVGTDQNKELDVGVVFTTDEDKMVEMYVLMGTDRDSCCIMGVFVLRIMCSRQMHWLAS